MRIDQWYGFKALHVLGDGAAQRRDLQLVHAREALIRCLQRDQRGTYIAGQRQFAAGDIERLFNFGQQPVVRGACQFAIHFFERHALPLEFGKLALELCEPILRVPQVFGQKLSACSTFPDRVTLLAQLHAQALLQVLG